MKYILGLIFLLIVVVISVTLGMQNSQEVEFNFLIAKGTYSLPLLLAVLFGSGLIFGWLLAGLFYIRLRFRLSRSERKRKKLEEQLRFMPKSQSTAIAVPSTSHDVIKAN